MFGGMANHSKVPVQDLGPDGKLTKQHTGNEFSSELFADSAIEFLKKHDRKKPFFAYVAFTAPHDPLQLPPGFAGKYDPQTIPLPTNFLPEHPFDHGNFRGRDERLWPWPRTPAPPPISWPSR